MQVDLSIFAILLIGEPYPCVLTIRECLIVIKTMYALPYGILVVLLLSFGCSAAGVGKPTPELQILNQDDPSWKDLPRKPISAQEGMRFAVEYLQQNGVQDVKVCRSQWIGAPLTAWLVDATGTLEHDGSTFRVFRVGIRDGAEAEYQYCDCPAGKVFVYLARGKQLNGETSWLPSPGPNFPPDLPNPPVDYLYASSPGWSVDEINHQVRYPDNDQCW